MGRTVRAAFVGAGGFSSGTLYPRLPLLEDFELVAVCDLDREKAERNARRYGAQQVYTDLDAMLQTEQLDGAFVVGDPHMMYAVGSRVLSAGLPIYVEKPPAMDVPLARQLAVCAEQHGVWGMVGYMKRFAPAYVQARSIINAPQFGGLQMLELHFTQGPYPELWGIKDTTLAFLTGQLCHVFDLVLHMGGPVAWLEAHRVRLNADRLGMLVTMGYASGALGTMNLNTLEGWEGNAWHNIHERLRLVGVGEVVEVNEKLYLTHSRFGHSWLGEGEMGYGRALETVEPTWLQGGSPQADLAGYLGEMTHFVECLREGHPPTQGADLHEGAQSLELTEAIYQSVNADGARVQVPVR